jgi:hypothetical protein
MTGTPGQRVVVSNPHSWACGRLAVVVGATSSPGWTWIAADGWAGAVRDDEIEAAPTAGQSARSHLYARTRAADTERSPKVGRRRGNVPARGHQEASPDDERQATRRLPRGPAHRGVT